VSPPEAETDNLVTVETTFRFLRPTTQGMPSFTMAFF
jgi:hypothetical protein